VEFPDRLADGRFIERTNRFLTLVDCAGAPVRAHLPNTGRLREILVPGRDVYLSPAHNLNRKTHWSLLLARLDDGLLVCVDSNAPSRAAREFMAGGGFGPTAGYRTFESEVKFMDSRFDLFATGPGLPDFIIEVKGVTLVRDRQALFPDAPTERGRRHVERLAEARGRGFRAAVVFVVMRSDADSFAPNRLNDPQFCRALVEASAAGVELYAFSCRVTRQGAWVEREIPIEL